MIRLSKHFYSLFIILIISIGFSLAQEKSSSVLETYVEEGLRNNLTLKQKEFSFQKSLQVVRQAQSLFYPSLSLEARYTLARGGRTEVIPVGDLVNPIYQSLNALLDAAENFPVPVEVPDMRFPDSVPNDEINFFRETDQETKLRLYQPVFQPEIILRKKIADDLSDIKASEKEVFKRELVAQIKSAYYQYQIGLAVNGIILEGLSLIEEYLSQAKKLVKLKKSTTYPVYRIEAEKSELEADLAEIEGNIAISKAYFNFLLNRPLSEEILSEEASVHIFEDISEIEAYLESALQNRQELMQVELGLQAAEKQRKLEVSQKWPTLAAVVDYGIQGEQYRFNAEDDFFAGSLLFRWNIFSGFRRDAKVQEAAIQLKSLSLQKEAATSQIQLEVIKQYNALKTARKRMEAAQKQVRSARRSFDQVNALYANQKTTLLDWLDGRTLLTNSQKEQVVKEYEYLILWADFQRIIGM